MTYQKEIRESTMFEREGEFLDLSDPADQAAWIEQRKSLHSDWRTTLAHYLVDADGDTRNDANEVRKLWHVMRFLEYHGTESERLVTMAQLGTAHQRMMTMRRAGPSWERAEKIKKAAGDGGLKRRKFDSEALRNAFYGYLAGNQGGKKGGKAAVNQAAAIRWVCTVFGCGDSTVKRALGKRN